MRRKDREITDPEKIREIIADCQCCRVAFCDQGKAYIVPLSFGYTEQDGKFVFYFHSAQEGRKLDLIRRTGYAGFEMDTHYKLNESETACGWSARFRSVIGGGRVSIVEAETEKREGLQFIMGHLTGKDQWEFDENMLKAVCVFKLEVEELACKEHQ